MGHQFQDLIQTLRTQLHDGTIHANAAIITGSGVAFSSGGDLSWLRSRKTTPAYINADGMREFYNSFLCIRRLQIPVVAAINGPAMGAGACLALATDLRVVHENAKVGFPFSTLGIHAGMGASFFLPKTIGRSMATEVMLTGRTFSGREAKEVGLVNRVVEGGDDSVMEEAKRLAEEIVRQNPLSVRTMVESIRIQENEGLEAALRREADVQAMCYACDDWGEGLDAAKEKKRPEFPDYHE
eukprot:CAMPEP_0195528420 /NCGR_PEP_ID=MMETSP0794_2-20130614/30537_1 /TAXON_ID=515487 /ORGANISM="Stephanopyxis turris, Strain CCMP 815" /LENGTH=240 /DNA_ID=CAMNT_0040659549 /DNA_START=199 /DNA_END=921 /DNA_ORIENTATION=+